MNSNFKNELCCQTSYYKLKEMVETKTHDNSFIDQNIQEMKKSMKVQKKETYKNIKEKALKDRDRDKIVIGTFIHKLTLMSQLI